MRLFVAVEVAPPVIAVAQELAQQLQARVEAQDPRARVTWIPPALMHLTLRFIGNVDESRGQAVMDALKPAVKRQPFFLELVGVGAFPHRGAPRVLWAGLAGGIDDVCAIEVEVTHRLQQIGIPPDERVFSPHLTLGRVREAAGLRTERLTAGLEAARLGTSPVDAITLFESRLSPKGPTYLPLQRTPVWKPPSPSSLPM